MGLKWLTPNQYNKKTGLGIEEIKKQFHLGKLEYTKTFGGYYKIAYYEGDGTDEKLIRENEKLRQTLISVVKQIENVL